ncbi:MAG TPA: hypothetical protein DEG17_23350 [Cyanobacteria bacterium UBA11149]|nr:hypothetical protein [Cyanobacteria bacterium UBA11367]HBE56186.1 hypothetical protein [Cyanobacteria bacterium UBA11366]HBK62206.1 hypothetical protein [Cyanobacteria bacterium UBA11166]HBR75273.1 hypothetical protein [Cyanobacteria bacterium UBA11159]HBS70230.1 hypothetical protein [Cyanobacteria bacterium UBA11153]HBW91718.1 hypothetical protein [Cyanobacteria bacterium UBA11149]HCA96357.1 hypothetical protein [Cyanobacteria bacterium UBA9226]
MKLSYRGGNYEGTPSLEINEGEIGGTYRGQPWRFHYPRHIREPLTVDHLQYRGIPYNIGKLKVADLEAVKEAVVNGSTKLWFAHNRRHEAVEQTRHNHLKNIQKALEHRIEIAKEKGDRNLVAILEKESEQMAFHS